MGLHRDYREILEVFAKHAVEYLLVGGYAVAHFGHPRFTKDLDLWVRPSPENLKRVRAALEDFGAPASILEHLESATPEDVLWMGRPPVRIDIVKGVPGGDFATLYGRRTTSTWDGVAVSLPCRIDLIALKRASGRPQDLLDVEMLERSR